MHDRVIASDSLASAIADERNIDWDAAESAASADPELIQQLKIISAIGARAPRQAARSRDLWARRPLRLAYAAIVVLATLEALAGALSAVTALASSAPAMISRPALFNVALFGIAGALLLIGGTRDRRVQLLGGVFVIIASAFADSLSRLVDSGVLGAAGSVLRTAPPESFFAAALWLFAWTFPRAPLREPERLLAALFVTASAALGLALFVLNVALDAYQAGFIDMAGMEWIAVVDRHAPTRAFWPLLLGTAVPAIPYLVWKSRFEPVEEKRRASWFVAALGVGIAPILLTVTVSPWVPALADPAWQRMVGVVLYASLASIVPATVYALAVHRVMDVQLIVRRTMQYALARHAVWLASIVPLGYLFVQMYLHRDLTVGQLLARGNGGGLLLLLLPGVAILAFRQQLHHGVDRWFFREPVDAAGALGRLDRGFRIAQSIREIAGILTQEVDRAIHPRNVAALVLNADFSQLVSFSQGVQPLSTSSSLVDLMRSARTVIQVGASPDGPVTRLLPACERRWLAEGGIQLLAPLVGSNGMLIGALAIGESRSQLPYTRADRLVIAAMSAHAAMRLENQRVWASPVPGPLNPIDWQNEPCACCPACGRVWPTGTAACRCGAVTEPGALPEVVQGKFRVERTLGSGGMGIVYLAVDIALDRRVAIKTLPTLTPARAASLQREARAMASVLHPNLAMIFGVETWRGTPLIVVEYLEGGTLADRLSDGALAIPHVVDLGILLADVLDRVHGSGILHRDIKPSNIGFTREGLVKLLDFGLAAMLEGSTGAAAAAAPATAIEALDNSSLSASTDTTRSQIAGTPLYLSPEALAGCQPQPSFDLWSLSLALYEAVAGMLPFGHLTGSELLAAIRAARIPDVRDYRPDCPSVVAGFFDTALASDAARRPQTAGELRCLLQHLRTELR